MSEALDEMRRLREIRNAKIHLPKCPVCNGWTLLPLVEGESLICVKCSHQVDIVNRSDSLDSKVDE
jgi:hypothetical protein